MVGFDDVERRHMIWLGRWQNCRLHGGGNTDDGGLRFFDDFVMARAVVWSLFVMFCCGLVLVLGSRSLCFGEQRCEVLRCRARC